MEKFQPKDEQIAQVRAWVEAAKADGWIAYPTYQSEAEETAVSLERAGFKAMSCMRPGVYASLNIWGPDGLSIKAPPSYSWEAIQEGVHICNYCGIEGEVVRIGFAGRSCMPCRVKNVVQVEYPGWTN